MVTALVYSCLQQVYFGFVLSNNVATLKARKSLRCLLFNLIEKSC